MLIVKAFTNYSVKIQLLEAQKLQTVNHHLRIYLVKKVQKKIIYLALLQMLQATNHSSTHSIKNLQKAIFLVQALKQQIKIFLNLKPQIFLVILLLTLPLLTYFLKISPINHPKTLNQPLQPLQPQPTHPLLLLRKLL